MTEPSGKAIEWTVPGAISFRLHVETWDGLGPHHQRPATPADLAAALVAAPQWMRLEVLAELPEWVEIDPVVLGLRDQIRRADRALVPALQAETDRLKRELADIDTLDRYGCLAKIGCVYPDGHHGKCRVSGVIAYRQRLTAARAAIEAAEEIRFQASNYTRNDMGELDTVLVDAMQDFDRALAEFRKCDGAEQADDPKR